MRPEDDAVHESSYTPDMRDHAENARNVILNQMLERPGADAFRAMQRLTVHPAFALRAHRFKELARGKAERDADLPPWTAEEIVSFERAHTAPAKTGSDLLRIVKGALVDISHNLVKGDVTSRPLLECAQDEDEVQHWIVEQLNAGSKGRFHAFREAEVAEGDKPDVICASASATCQVAIEIKHGGMGWTVKQLDNALSIQLAEDYLKPENRRHGVLIVTHHKDRRWQHPTTKAYITFGDVIARLQAAAAKIVENSSGAIEVVCVGINAFRDTDTGVLPSTKKKKQKQKKLLWDTRRAKPKRKGRRSLH